MSRQADNMPESNSAGVARLFKRLARRVWMKTFAPSIQASRIRARQLAFSGSDEARTFAGGENTFALCRIIGNDLPPLHTSEQALENLKFQLAHEATLADCTKFWLVNRIVDPVVRRRILELLQLWKQDWFEIPFEIDAYRSIDCSEEAKAIDRLVETRRITGADALRRAETAKLRLKRLYLMNNNGARNTALELGRHRAKWVLPWDGNCFITPAAWEKIRLGVSQSAHLPYHMVNMARLQANEDALNSLDVPEARDEPQIIFHRASRERFDEALPYGRRPKVELLQRLGVPGPWQLWENDPWDPAPNQPAQDRYLFATSPGWVFRLATGTDGPKTGKTAGFRRHEDRDFAILAAIDRLDRTP